MRTILEPSDSFIFLSVLHYCALSIFDGRLTPRFFLAQATMTRQLTYESLTYMYSFSTQCTHFSTHSFFSVYYCALLIFDKRLTPRLFLAQATMLKKNSKTRLQRRNTEPTVVVNSSYLQINAKDQIRPDPASTTQF